MKKSVLIIIGLIAATSAFSQKKSGKLLQNPTSTPRMTKNIVIEPYDGTVPAAPRTMFNGSPIKFQPKQLTHKKSNAGLRVGTVAPNGQIISVTGKLENTGLRTGSIEVQGLQYLEAAAPILKVTNPETEFELTIKDEDDLGMTHLRYNQFFEGVKIYNSEIILHSDEESIFMLNGRSFPTPSIDKTLPQITDNQALTAVETHLTEVKKEVYEKDFDTKWLGTDQVKSELVIFFPETGKVKASDAKLAWQITIHPNLTKRFEYFVDANSGEILHHFGAFCQLMHDKFSKSENENSDFHSCNHEDHNFSTKVNQQLPPPGPEEANAIDLNGQTRRIQTYLHQGNYFMIDAAKPMHNALASIFPNEASGVIWTIDGQGGTPVRPNSFNAIHVTSSNNTWNDRRAVSAHYNAEQAYLYFLNTHGRNSINNSNGNILSFFDIKEDDGSEMDNAFWNGAGIFYGNGAGAFTSSLAKALDVAGHEMAHGVIQTTANLEYQGESGALNESFADIFATMIDRDDWLIGEDIVNRQFFPSGAMRSFIDPHNGGSSLNDQSWQPSHYNERYTGREDNGGVHINSGIPNHAFYLFANSAGVGRERAENVFYRALDKYLVRSSQFVDFRGATLQAVDDLGYGASVRNALDQALDDVGIPGGTPDDHQDDLDVNPGDGFMLMTDIGESAIFLADEAGNLLGDPFLNEAPLSKVSVTDDGSFGYFIGTDQIMYRIDFNASTFRVVQDQPIWVNVAVSKDGSKIAALTDDNDNSVFVFDFVSQASETFFLYNPTFSTGIQTGEVVFPDVLEWDYSGEWVMYDALNSLPTQFGEIEYWDIGFLNVWDNPGNTFADGVVSKLYSVVPDNTDIGNPTFAKNSPYIIAFDFHEEGGSYNLMTANLQSGDESTPELFRSNNWNFPNFDVLDANITFDARSNNGDDALLRLPVDDTKLATAGDVSIFLGDKSKGVWFGDGSRITSTEQMTDYQDLITVFPNPSSEEFTIEINLSEQEDMLAEIYDLAGKKLSTTDVTTGQNTIGISFLPEGSYFVSVKKEGKVLTTERVVILR